MSELQNIPVELNIVELRTQERCSTKWKHLFATNVTVFAALLKSVPVECKDVLLPARLVKRNDVNCLSYKANKERSNNNLCLLRAICTHKTGTKRLEEELSKFLNQYLDISSNKRAEIFRNVAPEDLHMVEQLGEVYISVYDIEVSYKGIIGELAGTFLRSFSSTANLLPYKYHFCYVTDVNQVFKWFRCSACDKFSTSSFRPSSNI